MSNALNAILPIAKELKHFALQTGMSNYVASNGKMIQLFDEEWVRPSGTSNFYYALEDLLHARLTGKVAWTVHRPGLLMGGSNRALFNFIGSLCVYGAICKHLNLPFVFGGTSECWEESYIDGSDVRLVAEQQIWAVTTACGDGVCSYGQAFNAINGSSFTWKEIWPILGKKFGVRVPEEMFLEGFWFETAMGDKKKEWEEIVVKERLVETKMEDLANWEFLDNLFRFPTKLLGSRAKVDALGFTMRCNTLESISYWIDFMRDENFVP
ncbi:zinc finger family protein [Hibiscus syriacus]|uniref:Zinc finger family protein n=1 Tax=Hibiscus syriacus TaxID=106335 RepID=A0A6A2WXF8_HIBSY|nr:(S)-8-oxocitronellyl enol synthase ISY2-like [Hibiscus syriacus]KAE8666318.1 zinc finger family protein [Hibiscus syriacus]